MSIIREVAVEYSRTVNLGNYESERVQIGLTATVEPDELPLIRAHDLLREAREAVDLELRVLEQERQAQRGR